MSSATYQQSSASRQPANSKDPYNRLLWRFPPQRLEAEAIRDAALYVSGLLNPAVGGPSVFPPLPLGMPTPRGGWKVSTESADQNRRSVYIFVRRNARYPMLQAFDMPDTHESCARRTLTLTAPQALALLNDEQTIDWSRAFAGRVLTTAERNLDAGVETAYKIAYSRGPDGWEKDTALTFLKRQQALIKERRAADEKIALPTYLPEGMSETKAAAFVDFCHTLLNSNEFVFRY
jgi:hypothetical protein